MAAFRIYLEKNFNGSYVEGVGLWLDISDRCPSIGAITFALKGDANQLVISPPSTVQMNNRDGFFITEPARVGGQLEGGFEGRRVKITLERAGQDERTLGVFKVPVENGLDISRDGFAALHLESLAAVLEDAEASQVSDGLGWYQQVPWTKAIDLVRRPEAIGSLTLPDAPLPYESLGKGISIAGRPGDYVNGRLNNGDIVVATDVTYNDDEDLFVFSTLDALWKWKPTTGEYERVTGPGLSAIPDGWDILRVWYKGASRMYNILGSPVQSPIYIMLCAQSEVASQSATLGSGYWQPKTQAYKWTQIRFYAHDTATILWDSTTTYKPALAPVVYREEIENGTLGTANNSTIGHEAITGGGWTDKPEHIPLPFGQYVAWLALRRTAAGETPGNTVALTRRKSTYYGADAAYFDPLDGATNFPSNLWNDYPRPGAGAREVCNLDDVRLGRGYYEFYALWGSTWNQDTNRDVGVRFSMGQGPMVDISFTHTPTSSHGQWDFWLAFVNWDLANFRYQVQVVGVRSGTDYPATAVNFDPYVMPTFVTCDIHAPGGGSYHQGGAVFVGWVDPFTGATFRHYYSGAVFNVEGTESGVAILQANTTNHGATPTFDTNLRAMTFTPTTVADTGNRYYWTTKPAGGAGVVYHVSGRWVPVACGFFRERPDGLPVIYRLALSCFDRSECIPDPRNGRTGQAYRMLLVGATWDILGALTFTGADTNGTFGKDTGFTAAMPIMGVSKHGVVGNLERSTLDDPSIYFLSSESGNLYAMRASNTYVPMWLGTVQAADTFLGLGLLAVKKPANPDDTRVAGVTNPAFPLTANTRWPLGEYYGWLYGDTHSGRLPLLDMADITKWDAIGLVAMAGDSQFYFTRAGAPTVAKVPTGAPTAVATLTPSDYAAATRHRAPVANTVTRSVNDVVPGDMKVSVRLSPKSEWNLSPSFSGMGVRPLDLEVRCIVGGLVSEVQNDDLRLGKTNWAWRLTSKRMAVVTAQDSNAAFVWVENAADIEVGDRIIIDDSAQDLSVVAIISTALGLVQMSGTPTTPLKAGDTFWIIKGGSGRFSSEYWWDDDSGFIRSASSAAVLAAAGAVSIQVSNGAPFSVGCFFSIGVKTGLVDDNSGPYRVLRIRRGPEESRAGAFDTVEFEAVKAGQTGLIEQAAVGDPIAVWLNISQAARSVQIGSTGIVFTIDGGAGGTASNSNEKPAVEGDTVRLSYPGLVLKKNSQSKVTARDLSSIRAIGRKPAAHVPANKLLDFHLAAMDVERRLRRGTDGRLIVELDGVVDTLPDGTDMATVEPLAIFDLEDDQLLADRALTSYKARFAVTSHTIDGAGHISLVLEEVAGAIPGRAAPPFARGDLWTPADLPDLELWMRANSLKEDGLQDGNRVPFWRDESGNERHGEHYSATTTTWPTVAVESSTYTVDFLGSSFQSLLVGDHELLDNGAGQCVTVLGRKRNAMASASGSYISKYNSSGSGREWYLRAAHYTTQESGAVGDGTTQVATGGTELWAVHIGSWTAGGNPKSYMNGTLNGTAVNAVTDVDNTGSLVYVGATANGATNNLDGRVVEIIVTANPLSDEDRANLMAYMNREYPFLVTTSAAFTTGFDSGFEI